ncbi:hypothetical protein FMUAM8_33280 [Nocardia cyriacigeorgica]|nr:hypothetical protein FMUAM8_33280 [Nocardia cyriacigeorgica]BDU06957.1 hypothetical protein FMUBM48_32200 [Nocardia cyriacigeorgica]
MLEGIGDDPGDLIDITDGGLPKDDPGGLIQHCPLIFRTLPIGADGRYSPVRYPIRAPLTPRAAVVNNSSTGS